MNRLKAMEIFVRIVQAGGFGKAAETLSLPPSTVTRAIKELEDYLGVSLLNRTTRKLSLTVDGASYFTDCQRVLHEIELVEASFPGRAGRAQGILRVDTTASIARHFIVPRLQDFQECYPDVKLFLTARDNVIDLFQNGIDCVIRTGIPTDTTSLITRRLHSFRWVVCAAPSYLEKYGRPSNLDDLQQHHLVGYVASATGRPLDWTFEVNRQQRHIPANDRLIVNDTDAYISCALAGLGLIRAASYIVDPLIQSGALCEVLSENTAPPEPVSIMYPHNRHISPTVRAFIDWSIQTFSAHKHKPPS
ncbi:LysR family transcriptional regulator [Thalassospira sp.]|uniref:LysR family transcriptional regulator n=1 Tax=Thalassospira sp. TaxID=1912094 RepID=UPI00273688D4|nr:LysR family transcriptional regulator [Thalassospira sp.]MDP2697560.1 LysR family transcriptional regulator [Thalassospira sp.]